jgi:hypothetical protein
MIYRGNFHTKARGHLETLTSAPIWNCYVLPQKQFPTIHRFYGMQHLLLMTAQVLNISHTLQPFFLLIGFLNRISLSLCLSTMRAFQTFTAKCPLAQSQITAPTMPRILTAEILRDAKEYSVSIFRVKE